MICNKGCCKRTYCPLVLAYATTIHKFQGQNVGPVPEGAPPNAYDRLVCDPGTTWNESHNVGMLYTAFSRGTTFGDVNGMGSAVYFDHGTMNRDRVKGLKVSNCTGQIHGQIKERDRWVQFVKDHTVIHKITKERRVELLEWATTKRYTLDELIKRQEEYKNIVYASDWFKNWINAK